MSAEKHGSHNVPIRPHGLTYAARRFWDFLFYDQVAEGNGERSLCRDELIAAYWNDLPNVSDSSLMEKDRGFMQWFFPLPVKKGNMLAPALSQKDYEILNGVDEIDAKLATHFVLFIQFMGIDFVKEDDEYRFFKKNAERWNSRINHPQNNVRVTRVLESIKNFGFEDITKAFYGFLEKESQRQECEENFQPFSDTTRQLCRDGWAKSQQGTQFGAGIGH